MFNITFTSQMKEYLYRQMVLTDFELKLLLLEEREELLQQIRKAKARLEQVEEELKKYETT